PSFEIQKPNGVSPGLNSVDDPASSGGGRFFPVRRSSAVFLCTYDQSSTGFGAASRPLALEYHPPRFRVGSPSAITGMNRTGPGPALRNSPGVARAVVRTGFLRSPNIDRP